MFIDLVRSRRSRRQFPREPLTPGEVSLLMEAGDRAPSSRNLRPVRLYPVSDVNLIRRLAGCKDGGTEALESAVFAVIVAADPSVSDVWIEDCSIATAFMQMEAEDLGIGSCWIQVRLRSLDGEPAEDIVKRDAGIDPSYKVLSMVAFGRE